jgi:hypothetical protein
LQFGALRDLPTLARLGHKAGDSSLGLGQLAQQGFADRRRLALRAAPADQIQQEGLVQQSHHRVNLGSAGRD